MYLCAGCSLIQQCQYSLDWLKLMHMLIFTNLLHLLTFHKYSIYNFYIVCHISVPIFAPCSIAFGSGHF